MSVDSSRLDAWKAAQAERGRLSSNEPELPLYGGGGGGPMEPTISIKDYVDARDEAVESRLASKLDKLPSTATLWTAVASIIGGIFTALAITIGVLAFGADRFDGGTNVSPQIEAARKTQSIIDANQDAKAAQMNRKLDLIIKQTEKK